MIINNFQNKAMNILSLKKKSKQCLWKVQTRLEMQLCGVIIN